MNLLRIGRVTGKVSRHTIVEAHAEGKQKIGLLDGLIDP
jgi:hypothetical protein